MTVDQATEILAAQLSRQIDATAGAAGGWNQEAANALNAYKNAHAGETVGKDQWGNPVPLFGTAAGYQRNDSTIFSDNSQTTNPPAKLGAGSIVDYAKGVGQGIVDKVEHPIDTLKDAAVGVYDVITDPQGTAKQAQARNVVEQAGDGNFKPAGEMVGQQIGTTAVVTGAGTAAGVVGGKVVKTFPAATQGGREPLGGPRVGEAYNAANVPKLAEQLRMESARSPFAVDGKLTQDAISNSRVIVDPNELKNPAIPSGFGKYATDAFKSPSGDFQVHFYMNPTTGEVFYGLDYKAVFNRKSGVPEKP